MGEVVVSSGDLVMKRLEDEAQNKEREQTEGEGGGSSGLAIKWEQFLQRRMLRILLVEADDSTRQVIAALLRKCSYRVAIVSDGLKAWEVLKGRSRNIDLILTEVDLPAISGYALLTLIMEHEICKNIPVIMMSSHDSISTVYKCMLKGAADYLVKPIRKNELRNLWQHVWRRQTSLTGLNGSQYESVAQQKIEANNENNAASNHSNDNDNQLIEKRSEAQSSCTKPDEEVESASAKELEEITQTKCNIQHLGENDVENEVRVIAVQKGITCNSHSVGLASDNCKKSDAGETLGRAIDSRRHQSTADNRQEACSNNEAFDLDATFRRPQSHRVENKVVEERNKFVQSKASAFRRYSHREMQTSPAAKQERECRTDSEKDATNMVTGYYSETSVPSLKGDFSPVTAKLKESDIATSPLQQRLRPIPVPAGMRHNNLLQTYGSLPPMFCTQSNTPPTPSPCSAAHQEQSLPADTFYHPNIEERSNSSGSHGQNARNDNDSSFQKQDHRLECIEDQVHVSTATDQSAGSDVRDDTLSRLDSIGYGSNCGSSSNVDQVPAVVVGSKIKTDDLTKHGFYNRSTLREAALTKFRLKRKERCFGKKVRYESRKKLAEQRPRVKGQFVRQGHSTVQPAENNGD